MVTITELEMIGDSGNLALDLLNTRSYASGRPGDLVATPERLHAWLARVGLDAWGVGASPPFVRQVLDEVRRLRAAIRSGVEAYAGGESVPHESVHALNRALGASRASAHLRHGGEHLTLIERETAATPLARISPIALAAAHLLTEVDPGRIRQCASDRCVFWFIDSSKNGRRRWCSMARCGNRAKASRHYRKRKAAG